ncbi:GAF domain-containing protein [Actinoplanes sp. GCM10030250]|uniref:GAF domain-containing protein n=1 Tax=Actinoplanes sp. GCM10030250 TaxID=3273376 RepID=UPI0036218A9C
MAESPRATDPYPPADGALVTAMMALAGTPDHSPDVDAQLAAIANLTVERVAVAAYASVTALRGKAYTTVAVSDDLIRAVDAAQYSDGAGPCLDALDRGSPVGVPDIGTTVQWPGFHEVAPRLGLAASVSVPLFAGRGNAVAALNVYGHDRAAMAPLIAAICAVHGRDQRQAAELDVGGTELVAGYVEALGIRATIRLALEIIRSENRCGPDDAYLSLCAGAAEARTDLGAAAAKLVARDL